MESVAKNASAGRIQSFEYPADPAAPPMPDWIGWGEQGAADAADTTLRQQAHGHGDAVSIAEFERKLAAETKRSFESGREQGKQEGRQTERDAHAAALTAADQHRMRQAADLIARFTQERDQFLQKLEREAVELSLAVAARILRREAQMDPLLLTGAVRVALGQLSGTTEVRLRVPPAELELWIEAMALLPSLAVKPAVVAGEGMRLGDCVIETGLGSVDVGIRAQLGEIERGFFDRAGQSSSKTSSLTGDAMNRGRVSQT
jgi:flagellar assembly protein FliH